MLFRSAVAQGLPQLRDHLRWYIHTAAAALVGEGKDESGMFVAAGAGRAVGPDAGFTNFGEGAFDGGPEFFKLVEETLAKV